MLRQLKKDISWLTDRWQISTTVYVPQESRKPGDSYLRERQIHEYPENTPQGWAELYHTANQIAADAYKVAQVAMDRYAELKKAEEERS